MAQHVVSCACIADAGLDYNNPNTNYGAATSYNINDYRSAGSERKQLSALLKFNVPTAARNKRILSAILYIYANSIVVAYGTLYVEAFSFNNLVWDENTITYNLSLPMKDRVLLHTPFITSVILYSAPAWANIQLSPSVVQQEYEKILSNGIEVSLSHPDNKRVEAILASRESSYAPHLDIVYEDVPPSAPTPTDPIGTYKDSKSIIRFEWQYNSDVGGIQKAFDLQWSTDQSTWTTVSETTANNYYDMPADTLPVSNIYWRVRCYNEYDEVGPYSDIQSFYAIGAPNAPAINTIPTDTARPTVTWSAFSQQVYQLQVLSNDSVVYDSGVVPGINIRQHKIKAWLADGEYTVRIRIKNEYDLWSEWCSATFEIATAKPTKPSVNLQRAAYGIELHIEDIADYALIFRADYDTDDYICIGKTTSATYVDNSVRNKGEYKYFIRSVSADETFEDSDIKFIQAEFQHALIAPVSDLANVFVFTRSLNSPPKRTYNRQPGGAFVEYAGRKHPVWEPTEHASAGWSMTFFLKTWIDVERFEAIYNLNSTVLYRDSKGRKMYGILSNLSVNDERTGYTVSFVINQMDYDEKLEV